jgi:hypothetical protein
MPHKFKIGTTVNYHPKDRMLSTARGTYTITRLMPATEGQEPEYRIKHFSEEFERVAFEKEYASSRVKTRAPHVSVLGLPPRVTATIRSMAVPSIYPGDRWPISPHAIGAQGITESVVRSKIVGLG